MRIAIPYCSLTLPSSKYILGRLKECALPDIPARKRYDATRVPAPDSVCLCPSYRVCLVGANPLAARIGHTDPSKYTRSRSHNSAGDMACELLVPPSAMDVNLNFMHRCEIMPGGGVGHHFHNTTEEMFIIFDGQAEFTIDGRTAVLQGTVGAPCRMGHSHAIYNPSDKPVEFMNINVAQIKGHYDAFNLDDARVGAPKDPIPRS